jgi:hypothetical protein
MTHLHMVILLHKRTHTQTHKWCLKIQDKWLLSTYIMHLGEGKLKSDLWKLYRDGFTWSPYPMRGHIDSHMNRALKCMKSGS